jgi:IS30 family transposase
MHRHFNREDRIAPGALLRAGLSKADIARQIGFNRSSISQELARNPKPRGGYHALNADCQASKRRQGSKVPYRKIDTGLGLMIESKLNPLVSPEVVAHAWVLTTKRYTTRSIVRDETCYQICHSVAASAGAMALKEPISKSGLD